jgi:peptidoglycan/xylan/chitin deacetylase (PgdA/CDA1 family)
MSLIGTRIARKIIVGRPALAFPFYARWLGKRMQTRKPGWNRGTVVLSFDNDYRDDNEAAVPLMSLLDKFEIKASWAVVGRWVKDFPVLHKDLIHNGHELINHSWSHPDSPELRPGDLRKFNELSDAEVREEISRNHQFVLDTWGYRMTGFRLPHFRSHAAVPIVLKDLGYSFCSSQFALQSPSLGLPYNLDGLLEIPLAPIPRRPDRIPETYRIFRSPNGLYESERQFFTDFCELIGFTARFRLLTCVYLDPVDVIKLTQPSFESYLKVLAQAGVNILTLREVAAMVS